MEMPTIEIVANDATSAFADYFISPRRRTLQSEERLETALFMGSNLG